MGHTVCLEIVQISEMKSDKLSNLQKVLVKGSSYGF